jgi:hypothetical protein
VITFLGPSVSKDVYGHMVNLLSDPKQNINLVFLSYLIDVIYPSCARKFHFSLPSVVYNFILPFDVPTIMPELILIAEDIS